MQKGDEKVELWVGRYVGNYETSKSTQTSKPRNHNLLLVTNVPRRVPLTPANADMRAHPGLYAKESPFATYPTLFCPLPLYPPIHYIPHPRHFSSF